MRWYLVSKETGEQHEISSLDFFVGRDLSQTEEGLMIQEASISRRHAVINREGTTISLKDEESRNGTYLNEKRIASCVSVPLKQGDMIRFADKEYLFRMEETVSEGENFINIGKHSGKLENRNGRTRFFLDFPADAVPEYQKRMLEDNQCKCFLEMHRMEFNKEVRIYYDIDRLVTFHQILKQKEITELECLQFAQQIALAVKEAENLLIHCDQIPLNGAAIFIHPKKNDVKLVYLPTVTSDLPFHDRMHELLHEMGETWEDPEFSSLFHDLQEQLQSQYAGVNTTLKSLFSLERDLIIRKQNRGNWDTKPIRETIPEKLIAVNSTLASPKRNVKVLQQYIRTIGSGKTKIILSQVASTLLLCLIYLSDWLQTSDFIGFTILFVAADLWLMKSMKYI